MTSQEQDAIVGRLIREKSEALRLKAALEAEIKLVADICESVLGAVESLKPEQLAGELEPIRKYFNIEAYLSLLQECARAEADVIDRIRRLRELGVTD